MKTENDMDYCYWQDKINGIGSNTKRKF